MGNIFKKKLVKFTGFPAGFTLVEMLIVIGIVGLLTVLAVGSFGAARKQARLDIAVESMMTTIKEQQGKAKNGRQVADAPSCYGVVFQKTVPYLQTVTMPYRAIANDSTAKADYCDAVGAILTDVPLVQEIVLQGIQQGSAKLEKMALLFKPPFGAVLEAHDLSAITEMRNQPSADQNPLQIFFNERALQFDAFSGMVTRIKLPSL